MMMTDYSNLLIETEKILKNIYEVLRGEVEIHNPEVKITCPENTQKISLPFEIKKSGFIKKNKLQFQHGTPIRVSLRPLISGESLVDAIIFNENGFFIDAKKLTEGGLYLLDMEYKLKTQSLLDGLVERNRSKEVPNNDEYEYWMHAELKHPSVLRNKYAKLLLEDVDFGIDVGVSQDIDTVIPKQFKNELTITMQMIQENDPRKLQRLAYQRIQAGRNRGKKTDVLDSLSEIQTLFMEKSFKQYINVTNDFHYHSCFRGANFHDNAPLNLSWPKNMKVISRCDLNLDQCAAEGSLVYKKNDFLSKVGSILGDKSKK